MITDDGKQIIAKYLLGQAPEFASHIAAGVGAKPLITGASASISQSIDALDFEVFRVPILAKGFVKEDGIEKIIFKAEMPTSQRYLVSEVGLFPAAANSVAGRYDSKLVVTFAPIEDWSYVVGGTASAVTLSEVALDEDNAFSNISNAQSAQYIYSDGTVFNNILREERNEPPRFLNRALMISGSSSYLDSSFNITEGDSYLENTSLNFDFSRNSPLDKIKIALSVVSKTYDNNINPDNVRIVLQFLNNIPGSTSELPKATLKIDITDADLTSDGNPNRYHVVQKTISDFVKDETFSFANVNYIRVYASVLVSGVVSDDYFIIFDGIRLENVSTDNPLYSLIGYNIISTEDGLPILKQENTNNYIEHRFGIGVTG
jgi:hypothetical protein